LFICVFSLVCQRGRKRLARNFIKPHDEFKGLHCFNLSVMSELNLHSANYDLFLNLDVEMPPLEERQLPIVDSVPTMPNGVTVRKLNKKLEEMRGPEVIKNRLIYKQFGIIVSSSGLCLI